MPKRVCPFEENCARQLKVHLSEKEQTKTKQKTMENIWNRTHELLFKGAKKQFQDDVICHNYDEEKKCDFCLSINALDINDCKLCHGVFCSNCSLNLYKDRVTETVCLSCVD